MTVDNFLFTLGAVGIGAVVGCAVTARSAFYKSRYSWGDFVFTRSSLIKGFIAGGIAGGISAQFLSETALETVGKCTAVATASIVSSASAVFSGIAGGYIATNYFFGNQGQGIGHAI